MFSLLSSFFDQFYVCEICLHWYMREYFIYFPCFPLFHCKNMSQFIYPPVNKEEQRRMAHHPVLQGLNHNPVQSLPDVVL